MSKTQQTKTHGQRVSLVLTEREQATILAALRFWQRNEMPTTEVPEDDIASNSGQFFPLDANEIDSLCEQINTQPIDEAKPGVVGSFEVEIERPPRDSFSLRYELGSITSDDKSNTATVTQSGFVISVHDNNCLLGDNDLKFSLIPICKHIAQILFDKRSK